MMKNLGTFIAEATVQKGWKQYEVKFPSDWKITPKSMKGNNFNQDFDYEDLGLDSDTSIDVSAQVWGEKNGSELRFTVYVDGDEGDSTATKVFNDLKKLLSGYKANDTLSVGNSAGDSLTKSWKIGSSEDFQKAIDEIQPKVVALKKYVSKI